MKTGLGIRPELFENVFQSRPNIGFFEAHSENYFGYSVARQKLLQLRCDYPISLHGVGLSLGRADDIDVSHLSELRQLIDDVQPLYVSEHLAWSAFAHRHLPDLLPLPLSAQALTTFCQHIEQMQEALACQVLIENPSNYLAFDQIQMAETDFLNLLVERTGCGLLVDINNIEVSSINLGRDPYHYLDGLNSEAIKQYHLAGHTQVTRNNESVAIDTHNQLVSEGTWTLFEYALQQHGERATLVEWDSDFPNFSVLQQQCEQADVLIQSQRCANSKVEASKKSVEQINRCEKQPTLHRHQAQILDAILGDEAEMPGATEAHCRRLWVYKNNTYLAIYDYLVDVFPAVVGVVGEAYFKQVTRQMLQSAPPTKGNLNRFGEGLIKHFSRHLVNGELLYLPDLLELEWALHQAYFADNSTQLDPSAFSETELLNLPVRLNSTVALLQSRYPIFEIHRQSLPDFDQEVSINLNQSADKILVYKQQALVRHRLLNELEYELIMELDSAGTLMRAIENISGQLLDQTAQEHTSEEQLAQALAFVLECQLLSPRHQ